MSRTVLYFIPDWDDRVDPGYDFLADQHTPDRNPYVDDQYAHELFETPPYDGILLSLATLDDNPGRKEAIREAGSVHRYLRLSGDGSHEVLGDCGAFTYWQEPEPPYKTEDVLNAYQALGFDLGVSIDHLIFAELEAEKERRWHITMQNAQDFLRLHRAGRYSFTPIGVAQGWDAPSYQRAARSLVQMGYDYIAVGGLVRSTTKDVLKILAAVHEVVPPATRVHLFGVNRPEYVGHFVQLGITSFDSASRLRRAWMDGRRNYFLGDNAYTAIRIPQVDELPARRQRALENAHRKAREGKRQEADELRGRWGMSVSQDEARGREQAALSCLRAFDRGEASVEETHQAVAAYARVAGDHNTRIGRDYRRTLEEQPWKRCACTICRSIGVEVIIFRGNNRNRRRGFHNTWQLYHQLGNVGALAHSSADAIAASPLQLPMWQINDSADS